MLPRLSSYGYLLRTLLATQQRRAAFPVTGDPSIGNYR